jgi:hypothetical protein
MGQETTRTGEVEARIDVGGIYKPGDKAFLESKSPAGRYEVVFEDDGTTGYFYALDLSHGGNPIVDTVHVYNVALVTDRDKFSVFKVAWSLDGRQAVLIINDHVHAVFDFATRWGYCRTGFPPPAGGWQRAGIESAPGFSCSAEGPGPGRRRVNGAG